jgi:hypothetical protein
MPSLTGLGILSIISLPGTAVPGYRLFRPLRDWPSPVGHRAILPPAYLQYDRRVVDRRQEDSTFNSKPRASSKNESIG